jgi:hypothetical protein
MPSTSSDSILSWSSRLSIRILLLRAVFLVAALLEPAAFAQAQPSHERIVAAYTEPNTWGNRSNFYFGARTGVAIPSGATSVAPSVNFELGVVSDNGPGFGLRALFMGAPPAVPFLNVPATKYGFGAMADLRYSFPTIGPLTLYPTIAVGFLAGPSAATSQNVVLPLLNPGMGARVKLGVLYCSFEFGFAGFTMPYASLGFGYETDRRRDRAEAWAVEQEELARETGTPVQLPSRAAAPARGSSSPEVNPVFSAPSR